MFLRPKLLIIWLVSMAFILIAVNCKKVQRHKVLTFFFDGVPPLEGEVIEVEDSNQPVLVAQQTVSKPQIIWYEHEPYKDCNVQCHGGNKRGGVLGSVRLVKTVPELCYDCHNDYTKSSKFVHGPIAVGECGFCHNPHKTNQKYLLKKAIPELCYQCHEESIIESIPTHAEKKLSKCNDCHEAHAGSTRGLLKKE